MQQVSVDGPDFTAAADFTVTTTDTTQNWAHVTGEYEEWDGSTDDTGT